MRKHLTLLGYCVLFTLLFVGFYMFISSESSPYEVTRRESDLRRGDDDKASLSGSSRRFDSSPPKVDELVR